MIMMRDIQTIFTYLWTIWDRRNLVTHEGKTPKPIEVILTAQSVCLAGFKKPIQ